MRSMRSVDADAVGAIVADVGLGAAREVVQNIDSDGEETEI
jgi:predicted regulator of Ras-like GTPase activity (Roadblock/LC7/MglB family)